MMEEYFEYLDDLRESAVTNMFGACPYLRKEFGMDQKTAEDILSKWMETFDGESDAVTRAAKVA